jgi:hypothetical protein
MEFTAQDLAECAHREVAQRLRVYPRMVERGTMRMAEADRQIAMMRQIAEDYQRVALGEVGAQLDWLEGQRS